MRLKLRQLIAAAGATFFLASAAHAAWHQASTRHFVIYSEQPPQVLRSFAEKLERFDQAARQARGMADVPPSLGNRLTIFVLPNEKEVRRLANDKSGFLSGFYRGAASGSVAFIPRRMDSDTPDDISGILLHEYAHHLMMQNPTAPYPDWYSEGFAEFMAAAKFERDGSVGLGLPANSRYYGLVRGPRLPLSVLLTANPKQLKVDQREVFYGRGWLLTHYLTFNPARRGQFANYLRLLGDGAPPMAAAQSAFGDTSQLERELDGYLERKRLTYIAIPGTKLAVGNIDIRPLSAGASAALPLFAELKTGPDKASAESLAARLRSVGAKYPGDVLVETALSEAELTAGNHAAALAAADRALAANANAADAMILKGRALVEQLAASGSATQAQFAEARSWFLKANRIDPEDPEPLYEFHHSFVRGRTPLTKNAISALHYAATLAPQDLGLKMTSAAQFLVEGRAKEARAALAGVAYNPHAGELAELARRMIAKVDANDLRGALQEARTSSGWVSG